LSSVLGIELRFLSGGFEDRLFALFEDSSHSDIYLFIFPTEPSQSGFVPSA
jgi:hypothetical protein